MQAKYDFSWMRCLVIDDNQSVSNYLAALLREELKLKEVFVCYSANDALDLIDQNPGIHVVLCDLHMDKVDGLEMIRLLKEKRFRGYFGIISSMAAKVINSAEQLAKTHNINLLGSIAKPVTVDALERLLSQVGDKSKAESVRFTAEDREPLKIYEMIRGIEKEQFEVYYQPQVDISSRKVIGVEALARLNHPRLGLVYPQRFIAAMEKTTLIHSLTELILKQVVSDWQYWNRQGLQLKVSVNISAGELSNLDFPDYVLGLLRENNVPPEMLTLEVTESALVEDTSEALEMLNRLSMNGVRLSIDDFGTGHSSIERLRVFPFDELKIDQSFMSNASASDGDRSIVESSVILAKRLGLEVVFEGVETSELYNMSDHLGGDVIQGFFMSKAIPSGELLMWIKHWHESNR